VNSYDATLPTDVDRVRAAIGDVDMDAALYSDEAITARLATEVTVTATAISLLDDLIVRYANQPLKWTADGLSVDFSGRLDGWRDAVTRLRGVGGAFSMVPANYTGATTIDEYARTSIWRVC
jgi:hypothetical protein